MYKVANFEMEKCIVYGYFHICSVCLAFCTYMYFISLLKCKNLFFFLMFCNISIVQICISVVETFIPTFRYPLAYSSLAKTCHEI